MTNKQNTIAVFAFAALLMAMPLATGNVYGEEMDANLNASCGFSTANAENINFGSFSSTDVAATVGEEDAVFGAIAGSTASARVSVTVGDWYGTGTRATGTITLSSVSATDTVTVGTNTYTAVAGSASTLQFSIDGTDAADATALASIIRSTDSSNFNVSTGGSSTVDVQYIPRGTAGNSVVLSETGDGMVTKDSTSAIATALSGASDTVQKIMAGDTTKFTWSSTATQDTTYANKVAVTTVSTAQEILGGTDPNGSLYLAIMIDPSSATFETANLPYDGALTQLITITVESACDGT